MVTVPIVDGFTQDVITLVTIPGNPHTPRIREAISRLSSTEERVAYLRLGLVEVLTPYMNGIPPFVQSIVARALLDYVDWDAVVDRMMTIPENN